MLNAEDWSQKSILAQPSQPCLDGFRQEASVDAKSRRQF